MAERLWRPKDDDRAARSPHPSLRHRRDRQRKLALQEPRLSDERLCASSDPRSPRLRNPGQLRRGERCRPSRHHQGGTFERRSGVKVRRRLTLRGTEMPPTNGSTSADQQKEGRSPQPSNRWLTAGVVTLVAALIGALFPVMASLGAVYYSGIRQCNQDATEMETQLTSILLELSGREERIKAILLTGKHDAIGDELNGEVVEIEDGTDMHYGDPQFKDHSIVSLWDQYNRLLRRVQFTSAHSVEKGLAIGAHNKHSAIEELKSTGAKAN